MIGKSVLWVSQYGSYRWQRRALGQPSSAQSQGEVWRKVHFIFFFNINFVIFDIWVGQNCHLRRRLRFLSSWQVAAANCPVPESQSHSQSHSHTLKKLRQWSVQIGLLPEYSSSSSNSNVIDRKPKYNPPPFHISPDPLEFLLIYVSTQYASVNYQFSMWLAMSCYSVF